ncbi:hypothetical protein ACROYT_G034220 [Oculina patagonica]
METFFPSSFILAVIHSTSTGHDDACPPPQISDITFNAVLIGRVNSREDVFSELQCIDACLRRHSCIAYNMEIAGSDFYCTTLATVEKIERKPGSAFRIFERETIEKFLFQHDDCNLGALQEGGTRSPAKQP